MLLAVHAVEWFVFLRSPFNTKCFLSGWWNTKECICSDKCIMLTYSPWQMLLLSKFIKMSSIYDIFMSFNQFTYFLTIRALLVSLSLSCHPLFIYKVFFGFFACALFLSLSLVLFMICHEYLICDQLRTSLVYVWYDLFNKKINTHSHDYREIWEASLLLLTRHLTLKI